MNKDRNEYLAHVDWVSGRCQSMKEHSDNVAFLASEMCMLPELRDFAWMVGKLHDAGKLGSENQQDFENILLHGDGVHRNDLDHSTAGGWIGEDLIEKMIEDPRVYKAVAELLSNAIYFHHGIGDCISLKTGELVAERRRRKEIAYEEIDKRFFQIYDRKVLEEKCVDLRKAYLQIDKKIDSFKRKYNMPKNNCGTPYFYMGMYLRVLLSLLIDADWTDTACFFQNEPLKTRIPSEEMQRIWEKTTLYFENYLAAEVEGNPDSGSALNQIRQKISETCRDAAKTEENLYRLTVPTGAGKTLSSLRFALHHAKEKKKAAYFLCSSV
jgi:CRISPR-associated endonuclease/helicase Cas3